MIRKMKRWLHRRRKTGFGNKKGLMDKNPEIPNQEALMNIDSRMMKKVRKKLSKSMAYLSDAAIDATYISRFETKEPGWILKETKDIQKLISKLEGHFKSKAPMKIWHDDDEKKSILSLSKKAKKSWKDK